MGLDKRKLFVCYVINY